MGPITGFRVVNLRVRDSQSGPDSRDKVAYPDLTVDLNTGGHVVIGLENGGGKGTLLGFLFHIFAPADKQFLPRLAQRRQRKHGEERRIEQYVPGGAPTHVIVEVSVPDRRPRNSRSETKVLIGACLSKPAGASPSEPAEEFFWSARCVTDSLDMRTLAIRAGNRLLDHKEWEAWLKQMKTAHPDAEIVTEKTHIQWARHLTEALMIDVEFVKSWLLLMNQDEGAADRVFTYGSAREFLNTLVTAVANPAGIAEFHTALIKLADDADQIEVKRGRKKLLDNLVISSAQLAEYVDELHRLDGGRRTVIDALLATRQNVGEIQQDLASAQQVATEDARMAAQALTEANKIHSIAQHHETQARHQLALLELAESGSLIESRKQDLNDAKRRIDVAEAAISLAKIRTLQAEAHGIEALFAAKSQEAEPVRIAASSAVQVWMRRVRDEWAEVESNERAQRQHFDDGQTEEDAGHACKSAAEARTAAGRAQWDNTQTQLSQIVQRIDDARTAGDLRPGQAIADALDDANEAATELNNLAKQANTSREEFQQELDGLGEETRQFESRAARCQSDLETASQHCQSTVQRTRTLADELAASNLLELDSVNLVEHGKIIEQLLDQIRQSARRRQLQAELDVASVARTVAALEKGWLLPGRADVEMLCEQAAAASYGARTGWSYLSRLDSEVAERYARQHPGLASGIVVNIPEDLDAVVSMVARNRTCLIDPIVVGPPSAFNAPIDNGTCAVILPDTGFWSVPAAQQQLSYKLQEQESHQQSSRLECVRHDQAVRLRAQLDQWHREVGPTALSEAQRAVAEATETMTDVTAERLGLEARRDKLLRDRNEAATRAGEFNEQHEEAKDRRQRLITLRDLAEGKAALENNAEEIEKEISAARLDSSKADADIASARKKREGANAELTVLNSRKVGLRAVLNDAQAIHDRVVRAGDPVNLDDEMMDRDALSKRAKSAAEKWDGSVTDEQLKGKMVTLQQRIVSEREDLETHYSNVITEAKQYIAADSTRTAQNIFQDRLAAQAEVEELSKQIGKLEQQRAEREKAAGTLADEVDQVSIRCETPPEYLTDDIAQAMVIAEDLKAVRMTAADARERSSVAHVAAERRSDQLFARSAVIEKCDMHLAPLLTALSASGVLLDEVDLNDREFDIDTDGALECGPHALVGLVAMLCDAEIDPDTTEARTRGFIADIEEEVDSQKRKLARVAKTANNALGIIEAELRSAEDAVINGDTLLCALKGLHREQLVAQASQHHRNINAKLTVVADEVARFDRDLKGLSKIAFATVQGLLRSVHQAVKDSELPATPAMGRWSGLPLLKFSGLDNLTKEQREAAILAKLQEWFAPERRGTRPVFDARATVNALVEAATPRVKAAVLIPSDPLDARHKPVEQLAMTSGGEGVTVALILASLLASRRSLNHGHRNSTMFLDNPFSKVTKPMFLRLARDVAGSLGVRLILLTGIRDLGALTVFPSFVQLRVSHRANANIVLPAGITDDRLQDILHEGTLYVSAIEKDVATDHQGSQWPTISSAEVHWDEQLAIDLGLGPDLTEQSAPSNEHRE